MTRQEIEAAYQVDVHGVIRSPGKFESEPVFAPYFYDALMNGDGEDLNGEDGGIVEFTVTEDDIAQFPELGETRHVRLCENDQGFVSCWQVN
jgi:hypothetical protein